MGYSSQNKKYRLFFQHQLAVMAFDVLTFGSIQVRCYWWYIWFGLVLQKVRWRVPILSNLNKLKILLKQFRCWLHSLTHSKFNATFPINLRLYGKSFMASSIWLIWVILINPLHTSGFSIPPENIRKPDDFWCFQGV